MGDIGETGYDVLSTTRRDGRTIETIEFPVQGAPPATGHLVHLSGSRPRPGVLALHHGRGDRTSLLGDLRHLADNNWLGLSVDSPQTRLATSDRDPLSALTAMLAVARGAWAVLAGHRLAKPTALAVIGRGVGGEAAGLLCAEVPTIRVAACIGSLVDRHAFLTTDEHVLAQTGRAHTAVADYDQMLNDLAPLNLDAQIRRTTDTHWLLQHAANDDRFATASVRQSLERLPYSVRVSEHRTRDELLNGSGLDERSALLQRLCR